MSDDRDPVRRRLEPRRAEAGPPASGSRLRRVLGALGVLLLLIVIALFGNSLFRGERRGPAGTVEPGGESPGVEFRTVTLYFADPEGADLAAERRDLLATGDQASLVAATLEALAQGPLTRLAPTMPAGARIRHVFVDPQGTVYIDFTRELRSGMAGAGLSQETMLLRSLARTLGVNFRGIRKLVILVEGRGIPELAGYFNLGRPLPLSEWE